MWDELAILARPNSAGTFDLDKYNFIQPSTYTNAIFFDYNNDGWLDLLMIGQGGDWNIPGSQKFLLLYRNMGPAEDYRFERVTDTGLRQARDEGIYNPVSAGDFNHDGYTDLLVMTYDNGRNVELYLNDQGTGRFTKADITLEGATNGSVMLGDLDNDGWLDIEYSGYSNASATALKLYRNLGNGKVEDISAPGVTGAFQGQSTLADLDGDGNLDIISCGNGNNWVCLSSIYYNNYPAWRYAPESASGIPGLSRATPLVADFNADGVMDIAANGEPSDNSGYRTRLFYGNPDGKFTLDTTYPVVAVNQDGGINIGDWNGDGNMDLIAGGYLGTNDGNVARYSSPLRVYENNPAAAGLPGNTRPEAPEGLRAELREGKIIIDWEDGSDAESRTEALRYNLYIKNETTGRIHSLIPVDPATGLLKVGTDLQTSLSSKCKHYEVSPIGSGDYTIGVQTLDQSYAGSRFATCRLENVGQSGIESTSADATGISMKLNGLELAIDTASTGTVGLFTPDGRVTATASTPTILTLPSAGVYIVSVSTPEACRTLKIFAR